LENLMGTDHFRDLRANDKGSEQGTMVGFCKHGDEPSVV